MVSKFEQLKLEEKISTTRMVYFGEIKIERFSLHV